MMLGLLGSGVGHQVDKALEAETECSVFLGRRRTHDGGSCSFLICLSSHVNFLVFVLCHQ